jgi:hypothetical protein
MDCNIHDPRAVRHILRVGLDCSRFWLGITVGRVVLGFITPRIGERLAICIYLLLVWV